jgi:hypothetical protein
MKRKLVKKAGRAYGCPAVILQVVDPTVTQEQLMLLSDALRHDMQSGKPSIITLPPTMGVRIAHLANLRGVKIEQLLPGKAYEIKFYAEKSSAEEPSKLVIQEASAIVGMDGNPLKRNG